MSAARRERHATKLGDPARLGAAAETQWSTNGGLDKGGFWFCTMSVDAHAGEIRNKLLVSVLLGVKDEQTLLTLAGRSIVFGTQAVQQS